MAASQTTRARVRAESAAIARSVPAWFWLVSLVGASIIVRWGFGRRMVAPWIMVDEMIYSELAKSFASTGHFLVRGQSSGSYGVVYPLLISPAYRLFASLPQAYAAAKAINAVLMSLTAVPAYFLARRVVTPALALLAALLAVAVPSTLYAGTMMTENAFYPIFVCAALALVLCLERPTALRQLVLLAISALAYETRPQAVALVPALATAPLLLTWWRGAPWRSLLAFRWLYGILGAAVVVVLTVELARGHSPVAALGAYETAGHQHYAVGAVLKWLLYHAAELDLYLSLLPFAALLVLALLARRLDGPAQAFVAAAIALSVWLLIEVAAFASLPTVQRVEERNMFYLAPLFFTALLAWIERGLPRPPRVAVPAVVAAVALPALLPYPSLIGVQVQSDTLELLPWWWLQDHVITLGEIRWVVLGCAAVLGVVLLGLPRRLALVLPALVLNSGTRRARGLHPHGRRGRVHPLGERVLQPQRRARLRAGEPARRRPPRDRGARRPAQRGAAHRGRRAGACALRPHRRVAAAPGRDPRVGQAEGHLPAEHPVASSRDPARERALPRHVVRAARDVHPLPLPRRARERARPDRRPPASTRAGGLGARRSGPRSAGGTAHAVRPTGSSSGEPVHGALHDRPDEGAGEVRPASTRSSPGRPRAQPARG
ncbi:MAG: hypothetical protein E6G42_10270 [Actinobacteria bacterium]|nr:MAG: hypothetical protein E6G42_10270 [Actinomycetota bacterium]